MKVKKTKEVIKKSNRCWCGSNNLESFSNSYYKCKDCQSLLLKKMPSQGIYDVDENEKGYYGKDYWTNYIFTKYGLPDIYKRIQTDLYERCSYWLGKILEYKLPQANSVEIGCGNAGLVYLMKMAGYNSAGLELSNWVCEYAKHELNVKMYNGIFENQNFEEDSLDIVIMMDVLEHLIQPRDTLLSINKNLNEEGTLFIQTPRYKGQSLKELLKNQDIFLEQLKENEHVIIYNKDSLVKLLNECGFNCIEFSKPLFSYDMFLVASKKKINKHSEDEIRAVIKNHDTGRIVLALLDQYKEKQTIISKLKESEADRAARLNVIERLGKQLEESEADRAARLEIIERLSRQLEESEADRAARLKIIERLSKSLKK